MALESGEWRLKKRWGTRRQDACPEHGSQGERCMVKKHKAPKNPEWKTEAAICFAAVVQAETYSK